jgi:hypothetical protein
VSAQLVAEPLLRIEIFAALELRATPWHLSVWRSTPELWQRQRGLH